MSKNLYIKKDGAAVSAGSDVALVQAQGSRYCGGTFSAVTTPLANGVWAGPNAVYGSGENWVSASGYIVVPVSGQYAISIQPAGLSVDSITRRRVALYRNDVVITQAELNPNNTPNTIVFPLVSTIYSLNAGDRISIGLVLYGAASTGGTVAGGFFNTVLLETKVPVIAGQGLLQSGGAFQFDAQGNGFTDNYFEAETQVGWYTRADGKKKPVYKNIIVSDNPVNASAWNNTHVSAVGVERVLESSLLSDDGGAYTCYISITNVPGYFVLLCKDSVGSNARVILKYTKTTDAWE
jgi:hypothetical protein